MKRQITLDELKLIELETLESIHKICEEQNIRYSLAGGTLLGAIRHGGFIPWDDDIDLIMPRPDYNKLIEYCKNNETPFKLICHETDDKYSYLFAKAVNPNTVIIEENGSRADTELGIFVDIFPVDGLADDFESAKRKFNEHRIRRELLIAYNWKKFFRSKTRSIIYEPIRLACFILSRFVSAKKLISKIQKQYPPEAFEKCKYSAAVCGVYRTKEIIETQVYSEYRDITFEGKTFKAMKNCEIYLEHLYGDYMKLPPEEKRVSHHMFTAYWKD